MELRDSPLWNEIQAIAFDQQGLPPLYSWRATFLADGKEIQALKVVSLEIFRDYSKAYGDETTLEVVFAAGDFTYEIYPHRRDLRVFLSRSTSQRDNEVELTPDIESQILRATLVDDYSQTVEGHLSNSHSKQALNITELITVRFQLLDMALERIRLHSIGGLFRDASPAQILEYILTSVSTGMDLDEENTIKGVEMVDSPNQDTLRQVVIPHGTKFPELPKYIHRHVGGLYPTGMGIYLYRRHWYVYPLYDLTRFDNASKTLTVINIPTNQLPGIERTYRVTPHQVIAIVTGEVVHADKSESRLANEGNGVRYFDARRAIDGFSDSSQGDNKAVVVRGQNNNEFITDETEHGLNNIQFSDVRITANKFGELSKLSSRLGSEIQCVWENSDPGLIYPGMPVKFLYVKNDEIYQLTGIVLGTQHYVQTYGVGMADSRHRTDTALHLFVSREPNSL